MSLEKQLPEFQKYKVEYAIGALFLLSSAIVNWLSINYILYIFVILGMLFILFPSKVHILRFKNIYSFLFSIIPLGASWYVLINYDSLGLKYIILSIIIIFLSLLYFWRVFCNGIPVIFADKPFDIKESVHSLKGFYPLIIILGIINLLFINIAPKLFRPEFIIIWGLLVLITAIPFLLMDRKASIKLFNFESLTKTDFIVLISILVISFLIYTYDLNSWRYILIGDEYAFFQLSKSIAEGNFLNIFSFLGVYGQHPTFVSYLEAFFMKIYGINIWGWKMGYVSFSLVVIASFYLLSRSFFNIKYSVTTTLLLVFSFYHIFFGAYHTQAFSFGLGLMLLSLLALITAIKKNSYFVFYISGILLGMCLYVHYIARVNFLLFLVIALFFVPYKKILQYILPFVFGLMTVTQLWGDNFALTANTFKRTIFMKDEFVEYLNTDFGLYLISLIKGILINVFNALLSIFYSQNSSHHFVYGTLVDPITVTAFILGIITLIYWAYKKNKASYLLILLFIIVFVFTAVLSDHILSIYDTPPTTRLYFLLPFFIIISSIGIYCFVQNIFKSNVSKNVSLSILLLLIFAVNLFRIYYPGNYHILNNDQLKEALFIKAIQKYDNCKDYIFVGYNKEFPLLPTIVKNLKTLNNINWLIVIVNKDNKGYVKHIDHALANINDNKAIILSTHNYDYRNPNISSGNKILSVKSLKELDDYYVSKIIKTDNSPVFINLYIPKKHYDSETGSYVP